MKIGGVTLTPPPEEILVLPRGDQKIIFRARAVQNLDDFDAMVPVPKPPVILVKGEGQKDDVNDTGYKSAVELRDRIMMAYLVVKTLEPSEIEWTTVDLLKPNSLLNWEADLLNAGLTRIEVKKVYDLVMEANSLNEAKLEAARKSFLRGQQVE
jgi:hypothetical protein